MIMFRAPVLGEVDTSQLFNLSPNPYVILDRELKIVAMNEAYLAATMRARETITGRNIFDAFPSAEKSAHGALLRKSFEKVFSTGTVDELPLIPYPIALPDGEMDERFWSATHTPVLDEQGEVAFILQHTVDVTELHRLRSRVRGQGLEVQTGLLRRAGAVRDANLALGQEREYLRSLFEQAPSFMAVLRGPDHVIEIVNDAYRQLVGHRDLIGKEVREALPEIEGQGFFELLDSVFQTGEPYTARAAKAVLRPRQDAPPEERYIDFIFQPIADQAGQTIGIFVQGHDVTEQKRAEQAATESEARFRSMAQSMPNHVWTAQKDGRLDWFNDQVYDYSGASPGELDGDKWANIVFEEDREPAAAAWGAALQSGERYQMEFRLRRRDGMYRWHIARAVPVKNDDGVVIRWVGTNTDIEDQKLTAKALEHLNATLEERVEERTKELLQTQEVLRQSQKMEAIGNLAGGIAHDFNNLLQVVSGNLQLIGKDISGNENAVQRINNAMSAVSRGAKLSSQLLSFGRRQPLEPKVVNLGRFITEADTLIRRSIGEAIEIETVMEPDLWNTLVDPVNVENALLNLAINARDAMDGHGSLRMEARNIVLEERDVRSVADINPGEHVMLAVTDSGCGMPPDVIAKVFEPFFTTKPEGKGTGLGLSMVYGFVKQSGGHIKIDSVEGQGTTVRIYLPRSREAEEKAAETGDEVLAGGNETVLVVEDDAAVRETVVSLLGELGYTVLQAESADRALELVKAGAAVDLLFTDVVMPGKLRSSDLADQVRQLLPTIGILFTSGYAQDTIVHDGRLDAGINLLSKPYTREALAAKIRQVLSNSAQHAAAAPLAADAGPGQALEGMTILLCEDDALIRITTADALSDMGMTVVEAGAGLEALEATATCEPQLLIVDVGLPDMSGVDLAVRIRERYQNVPVIFATGHSDVPESKGLHRSAVLPKPYDDDGLKRTIIAVLSDQ
jgi:PAS domain S-box-containing protein